MIFESLRDTQSSTTIIETPCVHIFRQLCDLGFLSLLTTESSETTSNEIPSPLFQSDMIDHGLSNFPLFLTYVQKHVDRLTIRAGSTIDMNFKMNVFSTIFQSQ